MDTKKYEALLASARLGSFTKAAQELGYTQSGLTHMMNALEQELGFPLLERGHYGTRLTERGAQLEPAIRRFLQRKGYGCVSVSDDLGHLAARVHSSSEFPHEIGVFLDYPLDDVIRFIEQRGRGYRCSGCWKAYSNEQEARRRFELYDKCHRIYLSCHLRGFDVMRLNVAA